MASGGTLSERVAWRAFGPPTSMSFLADSSRCELSARDALTF